MQYRNNVIGAAHESIMLAPVNQCQPVKISFVCQNVKVDKFYFTLLQNQSKYLRRIGWTYASFFKKVAIGWNSWFFFKKRHDCGFIN